MSDRGILLRPTLYDASMTCADCGKMSYRSPCSCGSTRRVKGQTRRVMKPQPKPGWEDPVQALDTGRWAWRTGTEGVRGAWFSCPYGAPGDRLYVKEKLVRGELSWVAIYARDRGLVLRNGSSVPWGNPETGKAWTRDWLSPLQMPRWAARLWLPRTGTRVERVQDISGEDAQAEGWPRHAEMFPTMNAGSKAQLWFERLWDSINAKPKPAMRNPYTGQPEKCQVAFPWEDVREETVISLKASPWHGCKIYTVGNPWVWVVEFEVAT